MAYLEPEQEFLFFCLVAKCRRNIITYGCVPHPQEYFRIELGRKKAFILIRCVKIHTHIRWVAVLLREDGDQVMRLPTEGGKGLDGRLSQETSVKDEWNLQ